MSDSIYEASRAILASLDPERLPEVIVDVAMKVMGADDVSLMLPDSGSRLYIAYSHGLSQEIQAEARVALGERIAGRVALSREPLLLANGIAGDPRFPEMSNSSRVRSAIVCPLRAGDRLLGVLNLSRVANQNPFATPDLERASILASQVLLALENARLIRQLVTTERLASVGQLAAGIAHELSSPLSYVLSNRSCLSEKFVALRKFSCLFDDAAADVGALRAGWEKLGGAAFLHECQQMVDDLGEGAERMRDLSRDLKSVSRCDAGSHVILDLNESIRSALRITNAELRYRATLNVLLGSGVEVSGSTGRFSRIFINLLLNAVQAFGERPANENQVTVTSDRVGNTVVARVSDNGPGIRPEHLSRIFEAFFTTRSQAGGTGLGLSICRELARNHGGEISVESTAGEGATFTVVLPFGGGAE